MAAERHVAALAAANPLQHAGFSGWHGTRSAFLRQEILLGGGEVSSYRQGLSTSGNSNGGGEVSSHRQGLSTSESVVSVCIIPQVCPTTQLVKGSELN